MSEQGIARATPCHDQVLSPRCSLSKRVRDMALLWALFGAVAGAGPELASGSGIGILSGAIAGVIVTPVLGVLIALLGGELKPTLLGGIWGAMIGVLVGIAAGATNTPLTVNFGLMVGGMAGGTFPQVLRSTAFLARSVIGFGRGR
jgi:hypothetical protein